MRIIIGDEIGLVKVVDTVRKTITLPTGSQTRLVQGHADLAVVASCFSDATESQLLLGRRRGTLEVIDLSDVRDGRPLAIALPSRPVFLIRLGLSQPAVLVVCRGGEVLFLDAQSLTAADGQATRWPPGSLGYQAAAVDGREAQDWRLQLDPGVWRGLPLVPIRAHHKPQAKAEPPTKAVKVDHCLTEPLKLLAGYKLELQSDGCLETAAMTRDEAGRLLLLLGGRSTNLSIWEVSDDCQMRRAMTCKTAREHLKMTVRPDVKAVGALDNRFVYSVDKTGLCRVYCLRTQQLVFAFQATQPGRSATASLQIAALARKPQPEAQGTKDHPEAENWTFSGDGNCEVTEESETGDKEELDISTSDNSDYERPMDDGEGFTADRLDEAQKQEASVATPRLRSFILLVGDNRGGCHAFDLRISDDPLPGKRKEDDELRELYEKTKRRRQTLGRKIWRIGEITKLGSEAWKHCVAVDVAAGFREVIGSVEAIAVSADGHHVCIAGLGRKLFVFKRVHSQWKVAHQIYLKQKIYSALVPLC